MPEDLVLTDAEEDELLVRAGFSASEKVGYMIATPGGRALQRRAGRFLESYARTSPEDFYRDYVERRGSGPEGLDQLRALMDAYQITTRRAAWGPPKDLRFADQVGFAAWLGDRPDAVAITLLAPTRRFFRKSADVVGVLAFPSAEIETFVGTGESFLLITSQLSLRFGEDLVRVLSRPDLGDNELP